MNEEELDRTAIERCRQGDLDAFGTLIDRYERPIFNAILHMVGNAEDAREICQQVFMKAFEHLDTYDANRRFFSWIYRAAINESINHLKARRPSEPLSDHLEYPRPNPAESYEEAAKEKHVSLWGQCSGKVLTLLCDRDRILQVLLPTDRSFASSA